jgi:hypothetical protein
LTLINLNGAEFMRKATEEYLERSSAQG